jgi:hypothetical protein
LPARNPRFSASAILANLAYDLNFRARRGIAARDSRRSGQAAPNAACAFQLLRLAIMIWAVTRHLDWHDGWAAYGRGGGFEVEFPVKSTRMRHTLSRTGVEEK